MALNNPAFGSPAFKEQRPGLTPPPVGTQTAAAQHAGVNAATQAHLEGLYASPAAGAQETDRMTVEDTVVKTVGLFAILVATAVAGWMWTLGGVLDPAAAQSMSMMPVILGGLVGFVLAMVVIFTSRKKIRPALIFAYAAAEGLFIGGISAVFEFQWPGIVMQATLGTLAVVGVTLALFASGKIRASKRATKIFLVAMVGYLVFSLINVGLMFFGGTDSAFGLRTDISIAGIPLGVIVGVFVVIMAAYSLVLDFDQIQQGVRNGAPRQFGWMCAFGIMVTVVWLYVEILRILAILRGNN